MTTTDRSGQAAFGPFRLSVRERLLTRDGVPVEIGGRSLDLLAALVDHAGRVVNKRDLLRQVWPDVVVEDGSLRFHMAGLRKALGEGEGGARYIATQVGVGYAFVATVHWLPDETGPPPGAAPPDVAPAGEAPAEAAGRNLPMRLTRILGRESDIALLAERLGDTRLFTIVGPGGVGKTSLAVEIGYRLAPQFGGSVGFVDLATVTDPDLMASAIAEALAIPLHGGDPMAVVLGHVRARRLLLILDNCEHLVATASQVAESLEAAAPAIRILATSREPLRARGEHLHWLGALDYPHDVDGLALDAILAYPAVALFVARAVAGNSAFAIDVAAAGTIAEMCRRLDGMALPIELAAGRAATHGLASTAALLGEGLGLGWTGRRTALPRQQTLQATLDWSYALLTEVERHALDRLSVFVGPFAFDAAMDVLVDAAIPAPAAMAALDELTAKSLVSPDRMSPGKSSYRLLEMTRTYAAAKLAARGDDRSATARRHAAYYLKALDAEPVGIDRGQLLRALGNIRAALDWSFGADGDPDVAVRLAARSSAVFLTLSLLAECRSWCERALRGMGVHERATMLELELQAALGLALMFLRGNDDAAEVALRCGLDIAIALGDRGNELRLLGRLQIFDERIGNYEAAASWSRRAIEVGDAIGEPEAVAVAASIAGISHHLAGDQQRARDAFELCLRQSPPSERARTIHYGFDHRNRAAIGLSRVLWLLGYPDQATALVDETIETAAGLDHPLTHCIALLWGRSVHLATGDLDRAETILETFAREAEINALGPYIAATPGLRGQIALRRGQVAEAIVAIEESLSRLRAARYALLDLTLTSSLISAFIASGRHGEALALANATIDRCHASGELFSVPDFMRLKAACLRAGGAPAAEVEAVLAAALALARRQGARAWELTTATALARLWHAQGRNAEARALLHPIRDGFTEGFGTTDLRAADEVLRTLDA